MGCNGALIGWEAGAGVRSMPRVLASRLRRQEEVATARTPVWRMIRALRTDQRHSQYTLAHRLAEASGNDSVTREQVARWERGKRIPSPYWRRWLSVVLQVPTALLDAAARYGRRLRLLLRRISRDPRRHYTHARRAGAAARRRQRIAGRLVARIIAQSVHRPVAIAAILI